MPEEIIGSDAYTNSAEAVEKLGHAIQGLRDLMDQAAPSEYMTILRTAMVDQAIGQMRKTVVFLEKNDSERMVVETMERSIAVIIEYVDFIRKADRVTFSREYPALEQRTLFALEELFVFWSLPHIEENI